MYVGNLTLQWALKRQLHRRRDFWLPRPAAGYVMVHRQNVKNDSYILANSTDSFLICWSVFSTEAYRENNIGLALFNIIHNR